MLIPTLLSSSVLALTVNAVLIPLEVADKAVAGKANDLTTLINPTSQSIKVDCSTCPYAIASTRNGQHEWTSGVKSDLLMDFTIEKNQLLLNGRPLFQPQMSRFQPLKIKQVAKEGELEAHDKKWDAFKGDLGMSYSVELSQENGVNSMEIQVLGLDGEMVNTDAVSVRYVKKADGDLLIQSITTHPNILSPAGKQCKNMMCRVMSILKAKMRAAALKAMKAAQAVKGGCMRKFGFRPTPPHSALPPFRHPKVHGGVGKFAGKFHHGGKDSLPKGDMPPHAGHGKIHNHHHQGTLHMVLHAMTRIFRHVILPILIGVAAGMAASAVGMLVGQIIVLIWMRYRRSGKGAYEKVEQVEEARVSEDGLPKYEELEGTEIEVVDEKKEVE
ncbi:MAG: hypothetical protein Q9187_001675 [Circinaria calcarea]